uniref:Sin3a_C domain-containing protein n=1 Tax=Echinostoma caproni TaxID=27848 RepID=A0A183AH49_9TREM
LCFSTGGVEPSDYYNRALNLVKDLLDGGEDIATYEDRLRDMFGIFAYPWFTLDRLVINIVRQLQALASGDELSRRLTNLYRSWTCGANYSASGTVPMTHRFNHAGMSGASSSGSFITLPQHSCDSTDVQPQTCMLHHMNHWPACMTQQAASSDTNGNTSLCHQTPARHWSDYLYAHLLWTSGYMPHNVARHIRPVFLYRTVRRCMNALTRAAYRRRQQELVDTGDTQPEELLMKTSQVIAASAIHSADEASDADERQETGSVCCSKNGNDATNFQQDVWEFMCHVFKSDLTRRELFRDTYSSDCMQSTDRLTSKNNPRAHKINWSVGSYGIFVRRKPKPTAQKYPSAQRWHEFHAKWLAIHASQNPNVPLDDQASGAPSLADNSNVKPHANTARDEPCTRVPSESSPSHLNSSALELADVSSELAAPDTSDPNLAQPVSNEAAPITSNGSVPKSADDTTD